MQKVLRRISDGVIYGYNPVLAKNPAMEPGYLVDNVFRRLDEVGAGATRVPSTLRQPSFSDPLANAELGAGIVQSGE
jgi:hypothetical protein